MNPQIHVFVSHSWKYGEHYDKIIERLKGDKGLFILDYSVPKDDSLDTKNDRELKEALGKQIRQVHVVIIPAGMYVNHSKWIGIEIKIAKEYGKKILLVEPWGQEKIPVTVQNAADLTVGWKKNSVIEGVRKLYDELLQEEKVKA